MFNISMKCLNWWNVVLKWEKFDINFDRFLAYKTLIILWILWIYLWIILEVTQ